MGTTHLIDREASSSSTSYEITTAESSYGVSCDPSAHSILNLSDAISRTGTVTAKYSAEPCETYEDGAGSKVALEFKRTVDIGAATMLMIGFSPLLLICAALVSLTSKGSVFYKQLRVGKNGRVFPMWKFRTMYEDSDQLLERYLARHPKERREWEQRIKLKSDPRVTPIGRMIRRFSIDEMPQLWNVLVGDMSLIGPRPITVPQISRYGVGLRLYSRVRPGLTGLWQISGRSTTTFETRILFDKKYVENWSLMLDLWIWLRTFGVVLTGAGAY